MTNRTLVLTPGCIKTLSAVEALPNRSNQHEFNGVKQLKDIFGTTGFSQSAKFSIRGHSMSVAVNVTWYDAREAHPKRTEHRLYFQTNEVMQHASEGDNILIGFEGKTLHIILIPHGADGFRPDIVTWEAV